MKNVLISKYLECSKTYQKNVLGERLHVEDIMKQLRKKKI